MSMRKEIIINKRKKKEKENIIWQSIKLLNKFISNYIIFFV